MIRRRRLAVLVGALLVADLLALQAKEVGGPSGLPRAAPTPARARPAVAPGGGGVSVVARATGTRVEIFANRGAAAPARTLPNPWLLNNQADKPVEQVFLVERQQPGWVEVLLPERPNGTTGWVRSADVLLEQNPYHVQVSLSAHEITVFEGERPIYRGPVATGAAATPTPVGLYYTRVLLQNPDPSTVYGPYAYGLSAHSEALSRFEGGDAEVGIHGNNDPSVLGRSVTHGCVRMDNGEISKLSRLLPLGTPVEIKA